MNYQRKVRVNSENHFSSNVSRLAPSEMHFAFFEKRVIPRDCPLDINNMRQIGNVRLIEIAPSILTADFGRLVDEIPKLVE